MQVFESCLEAMRAVKKLVNDLDLHEDIYFAYSDYYDSYIVTDSDYDLKEKFHQTWADNGCDAEPEHEAEKYKIWIYKSEENKFKWSTLYRDAKYSRLKTKNPAIRCKARIIPEYSVEFGIVT